MTIAAPVRPSPVAFVTDLAEDFRRAGNEPAAADADRVAALLRRVRPYRRHDPVPVRGEGHGITTRRLAALPAADQRAVLLAGMWGLIDTERISRHLSVGWLAVLSNRPGRVAASAVRLLLAGIPKPDLWRVVRTPAARTAAGQHALRVSLIALAGEDHREAVRGLIEAARRLNPKPETWAVRHAHARFNLLIDIADGDASAVMSDQCG